VVFACFPKARVSSFPWAVAACMAQFAQQLTSWDSSEGSGIVPEYECSGFSFVGAYLTAAEAC